MRCPLWLKPSTRAGPQPSVWSSSYYFIAGQLFPLIPYWLPFPLSSLLFYCRFIGLTTPCLLSFSVLVFPCLFSITWYLAFLAADWSGLSVPHRSNCFIVVPWSLRPNPNSPGHTRIGTESVTLLAPPFLSRFSPLFPWRCCASALRVPFLFCWCFCLSFLFGFAFSSPLFLSVYWSGLSVLFLSLSSLLSLCFLSPSGVVPGLSGRRLVRISSATLFSSFLSTCSFPSLS